MCDEKFQEIAAINGECDRLEAALAPALREFARAWNAIAVIESEIKEAEELSGRLVLLHFFIKRFPLGELNEGLALASIRDVSDKIRSRALARRGVMVS